MSLSSILRLGAGLAAKSTHERAKDAVYTFFKATMATHMLKIQFIEVYLQRSLLSSDKRNIRRIVSHMKVKQEFYGKYRKQFNKQMNSILKNPDHKHYALVAKHTSDIMDNSYKYFLVLFNLQLTDYLVESASRVINKAPLAMATSSNTISDASILNSILDITQKIKLLDQIEVLIKKKDPVYMAANSVRVKKAFFEGTLANLANYRLENVKSFQKIRVSVWKLEYCKQVLDAISKFTTSTGQSVTGIDEVKLEKSDTGKTKVPSLRYLNRTLGSVLSREEQEAIAYLKSIKSVAELADSLKRRRRFNFTLKSDFLTVLIGEMAAYFAGQ